LASRQGYSVMTRSDDDYVPVTGDVRLRDSTIRDDTQELRTLVAESDLDKHIVRLLALHPQLKVRFRSRNPSALDDLTKETLLADINKVLGIRPLRKTSR
jgi:hypothetical protein